jgi:hypothetical protein
VRERTGEKTRDSDPRALPEHEAARRDALRRANCAGRECEERDGCRRFKLRLLEPREVREDEKAAPWHWVSADVERGWFGNCALRIEFRER